MTDCETLSHLGGQILPHNHSVLAFVEVSSNNTIHQKNDMGHEVTNYSRRHTREPQGTRENGFDTIPTQCKFDTIQQNETMTFYSFFSLRITPHIFGKIISLSILQKKRRRKATGSGSTTVHLEFVATDDTLSIRRKNALVLK